MPHVVLTGAESTYKTRLCEALSEWLNMITVPEYAREYMRENELDVTGLNEAVFNTIATGQIEQNVPMAITMYTQIRYYLIPMA